MTVALEPDSFVQSKCSSILQKFLSLSVKKLPDELHRIKFTLNQECDFTQVKASCGLCKAVLRRTFGNDDVTWDSVIFILNRFLFWQNGIISAFS